MIQDLHVRGLAIACHLLPHSRWCSRRCGDKGRQLWHARRPRTFVGACHFEKIRGRKQPEKLRGPEALFFKSSLDLSAVYLRRSCLEYAKVSQRGTPGLGVQIADVRLWTETSKRVSINKREKVKKRVKETRRKKSKEAKKNPQWKSSACLFWFAVASVKGTFSHRWACGHGVGWQSTRRTRASRTVSRTRTRSLPRSRRSVVWCVGSLGVLPVWC